MRAVGARGLRDVLEGGLEAAEAGSGARPSDESGQRCRSRGPHRRRGALANDAAVPVPGWRCCCDCRFDEGSSQRLRVKRGGIGQGSCNLARHVQARAGGGGSAMRAMRG